MALNCTNLTAISYCYANFKTLGVFYSQDIMELIYSFEAEFPLASNYDICDKENFPDVTKTLSHETRIIEYYNPPKLLYAQSRVNFKFIKFIKASNNCDVSPLNEKIEEILIENKNDLTIDQPEHNKIKESEPLKSPDSRKDSSINLLSLKEALNNEAIRTDLKIFRKKYMELIQNSSLSDRDIIRTVCDELKQNIKIQVEKTDDQHRFCCQLIFDESVLLSNACRPSRARAINEAILEFVQSGMRMIGDHNRVQITCCPPEVLDDEPKHEHDDEIVIDSPVTFCADGAEIDESILPDDFFLRDNRTNTVIGILNESFQAFKLVLSFSELDNSMYMLVNGSPIASIPVMGNNAISKTHLCAFVLGELQKSRYTLTRNTFYHNEFDQSVSADKDGLYLQNNTADPTRIRSDTNVGGQLMLKMGWTEDLGLGKTGDGIKEPIINDVKIKRHGFGFELGSSKDLKSFSKNVSAALRNWMQTREDDLIFDRQFDNKERAIIHKECRKLGLASKSYNNSDGDRFLVVTCHRSPIDLFNWVRDQGGTTKLYTLMPPGSLSAPSLL